MDGSDRGMHRLVLGALVVAVVAGCGTTGEAAPATADTPAAPTATVGVATTDDAAVGVVSAEETAGGASTGTDARRDDLRGDGSGLSAAELESLLADRYHAYWDAFDAARAIPTDDPAVDFPRLRQLAAGEQLASSYDAITDLAVSGEARREPPIPAIDGTGADDEHRVRVDRIEGAAAELAVCVVVDDVRYVTATDTVVDAGVATVLSSATLALDDGEWKVIRSRAVEVVDGVGGCWLTDDADFPH
ncbi:MAG: hypothetical protein ACFCVK_07795 [Acidimicrobiales bacterium]